MLDVPEVKPTVYDQDGRLLSVEDGGHCSRLMWEIIEEAFKYSDHGADSIPQDRSLLDFFKFKLKEKNIPTLTAERVLNLCQSWGDYIGGDIDRQSLKYLWLEETIDGGKYCSISPAIEEEICEYLVPWFVLAATPIWWVSHTSMP